MGGFSSKFCSKFSRDLKVKEYNVYFKIITNSSFLELLKYTDKVGEKGLGVWIWNVNHMEAS